MPYSFGSLGIIDQEGEHERAGRLLPNSASIVLIHGHCHACTNLGLRPDLAASWFSYWEVLVLVSGFVVAWACMLLGVPHNHSCNPPPPPPPPPPHHTHTHSYTSIQSTCVCGNCGDFFSSFFFQLYMSQAKHHQTVHLCTLWIYLSLFSCSPPPGCVWSRVN